MLLESCEPKYLQSTSTWEASHHPKFSSTLNIPEVGEGAYAFYISIIIKF